MSFERARSKENKEIRLNQIKEAAIKLFDEKPYHEISLSNIGKEINFTRANLYKYVSSKEDIFLHVTLDEFRSAIDDAKKALIQENPLKSEVFCRIWAETLSEHDRFLKLLSLMFTVIENNVKIETLIDFKNSLYALIGEAYYVFQHNFPDMSEEEISKLLNIFFSMVIGTYPMASPTAIQKEATARSNYNYSFPSFSDSLSESMILVIKGMRLSKL